MPTIPPPHPPHHLLKKPTSFPDVIFTAYSLLVLFSTSPIRRPAATNKLSFPSYTRKFPKMSSHLANPRKPGRRPLTPPFATPQCLSDWLRPRLAAESLGSWGVKPGTKNVHNLWLEVAEGETSLSDSNPPVRTVEVVIVRIKRNDGEKLLIESHQELSNGVVRYRSRPLSEKMKPGESVEAAVFRAVKEELGSLVKLGGLDDFEVGNTLRILPGTYVKKVEERVSASYPGLPACYVLHMVDAEVAGLPETEFCTEEADEYEVSNDRGRVDCAVSCRKHYWKWVDCDSI